MKFNYYPGCTLKTKAKELDRYARACAQALGIELVEIENWQCCGGVYPMAEDEIATKLSSIRLLADSRDKGLDLLTVCSACYNVLKRVNVDMRKNEDIKTRANNYLKLEKPYLGEAKVYNFIEVIRDSIGFDALKEKVVAPLKDRNIAAYYGCLLLHPYEDLQFDDPENPSTLENMLLALGANPIKFAHRNECCGGYVTVKDKEFAKKRAKIIIASAKDKGAQEIITACPLCAYNLERNAGDHGLKISYFTQVLAQALGIQ